MSEIERKVRDLVEEIVETQGMPPYASDPKSNKKGKMPGVRYSGPVWDTNEITAAITALLTGKWLASGEKVRKFEKKFSEYIGARDSVMVNSGSSANLVMIAALKKRFGWKDGDEVIVSCVGFPTTINPLIQNGLKPVFVDISWDDLNWSIDDIQKKITDRTVAVFSSPVLGNPYDLERLSKICKDNSIKMIGDNCDTLGTLWKGKHFSSYFVASSCSFYPAHHISTGEGGMVSSDDPEIITTARSFAWWGRDCYCVGPANMLSCGTCGNRFDKWLPEYEGTVDHKYIFVNQGYNLKPLDMQGAIGLEQIKKLPRIHKNRRYYKEKISSLVQKIPGTRVPDELPSAETSWFGVPVICETSELKESLVNFLETRGIQTRNYFAGNILLHPGYRDLGDPLDYPNACKVLGNVFFLGCSPNYTEDTLKTIQKTIDEFLLR